MNENNQKTDTAIEREELNRLVKRGVKFDILYTRLVRSKGIRGFFQRKHREDVVETYEVHEPTLAVLDRLSDVWLDLHFNEDILDAGGKDTLTEAKKIANDNANKLARVVAIAVLGEDYHVIEVGVGGKVRRYNDDKELDRLTELFFHTIQPSKLLTIANAILNISNLGDFIGSMRLMSGARTTLPKKDRIE